MIQPYKKNINKTKELTTQFLNEDLVICPVSRAPSNSGNMVCISTLFKNLIRSSSSIYLQSKSPYFNSLFKYIYAIFFINKN